MTIDLDTVLDANRKLWDARVAVHRRDATGFYRVNEFLAGADVLGPIEASEIGDVRGLRIAHLQCHFGMDTICLARRGAVVTGLDFSSAAIAEARRLADEASVSVEFVEGNVYHARSLLNGQFDMVYTTWGTIIWLPDVVEWARAVSSLLRPGGHLYFVDGHPMMLCMEMVQGKIALRSDWRTLKERPIVREGESTYTGDKPAGPAGFEWIHPVADMVNALVGARMRLDWVKEHTCLPWPY